MLGYVGRRLLQLVPTLVAVSVLIFLMVRLIPGDPALLIAGENATPELLVAIRQRLDLDRPLPVQYGTYLRSLLRGDLGTSIRTHRPVAEEILSRLPATVELAAASGVIFAALGILLGVVAGVRRGRAADHAIRVVSLVGVSSPDFWIGILLMLVFSLQLRLLPSSGRGGIAHVVLPAVTASLVGIAFVSRLVRASIVEILGEDYVRTAWAKGLGRTAVLYRHTLSNALIPAVTILGLEFGVLLGGLVVVESVFAWPGSGKLLVDAIRTRDYPVVQAVVLLFAVMLAVVNLLVDVLCGVLDPRIRLE